MPMADEMNDAQLRLMLYGRAKLKKTWWAMNAAAAGFNVLILDGDKGTNIIHQTDPAIRKKIRIVGCADKLTTPVFGTFLAKFLAGYTLRWDDKDNRVLSQGQVPNPEHAHFVLDASKLTKNDVLVLDSWSALDASLTSIYAKEQGLEVTQLTKDKGRDMFMYKDRLLTWMLTLLAALPCHLILIGHETVNELTEPKEDSNGKIQRELTGEVYTQIQSSSRPHGLKLAKYFTDILYFTMRGSANFIDTRANAERDGGSRLINAERPWDKLQFADFANIVGSVPDAQADMAGCVYYRPGELPSGKSSTGPSTGGGAGEVKQGGGFVIGKQAQEQAAKQPIIINMPKKG